MIFVAKDLVFCQLLSFLLLLQAHTAYIDLDVEKVFYLEAVERERVSGLARGLVGVFSPWLPPFDKQGNRSSSEPPKHGIKL